MTHSMRKSTGETGDVFTIGIWTGSGWNSVRDFDDGDDAAAFCNYLNGGDGKQWHPPSKAAKEPLPAIPLPEPEPEPEPGPESEPEPAGAPTPPYAHAPESELEPWETDPRPTISAQRKLGTKRPKR